MLEFDIILRLINSLFTIGLGLFLLSMYISKKTRFISLLAWSIAFIFYGIEILARIWLPYNSMIVAISSFIMAPLFILGTSILIRKIWIYMPITLVLLSIAIYLYPSEHYWNFGIFAYYGVMTIAVANLRFVMGNVANRLIVGWTILLVGNILFLSIFDFEWIADLAAIPAKTLLALGMLDQRFARMIFDIKKLYKSFSSRT